MMHMAGVIDTLKLFSHCVPLQTHKIMRATCADEDTITSPHGKIIPDFKHPVPIDLSIKSCKVSTHFF